MTAEPQALKDAGVRLAQGSVLCAKLRGLERLSTQLESEELAALLSNVFNLACRAVTQLGGQTETLTKDGVLGVFSDTSDHARRALASAVKMWGALDKVDSWMKYRFQGRELSGLDVSIGVHSGTIVFVRSADLSKTSTSAAGDTMRVAAQLAREAGAAGWKVAASSEVCASAGAGIDRGAERTLQSKYSPRPITVLEVRGIAAADLIETASPDPLSETLKQRVQLAAQITAHAVKPTQSGERVRAPHTEKSPEAALPQIKGFEIIRKLGEGGMAIAFLARRQADGQELVLKVFDANKHQNSDLLHRFIVEYATLSEVSSPHVVKIYDQGFTDDAVYIAMEYFPGGDLKAKIARELTPQDARAIARQMLVALQAIHSKGILP